MNSYATPDSIYLARNGERAGPFRMDEVRALVSRGEYSPSDLAWYPGAADWTTLGNVPGFSMGAMPPAAPYPPAPAYAAPGYGAQPSWQQPQAVGATRYAGFWIRVAALIIDAIVLYIPLTILQKLAGLDATPNPEDLNAVLSAALTSMVLSTAVQWAYRSTMHSSQWQATVGKMAVGIRVTDRDGGRISFARASGRYLAEILSGIILGIGYIMAAFTERKQALHDKLADTVVVYR